MQRAARRCGALLWRHTSIGSQGLLSGGAILPAAIVVPFLAAGHDGITAVTKTVKSYPDPNGDPNYIANLNQQPDHGYSISVDIAPRGESRSPKAATSSARVYHARGK